MKKIFIFSNSTWNIYNFRLNLVKKLLLDYQIFILAPQDINSIELKNLGCNIINIKLDPSSISLIQNFSIYF